MGIPNKDDLTKDHASAQLSLRLNKIKRPELKKNSDAVYRVLKTLVAVQLSIIFKTLLGLI
jgi:hypothetical protein